MKEMIPMVDQIFRKKMEVTGKGKYVDRYKIYFKNFPQNAVGCLAKIQLTEI